MELDFKLEGDAHMELYCDVLVRYLLVDSALGECALAHRLEQALESGQMELLAAELRYFESLPGEMKLRILEGDPTLQTEMDGARVDAAGAADVPVRRSASA